MATPSSPETVHRKPVAAGPLSRVYADGEGKENAANFDRKPLPSIPIPPSARIHGAPMSPVKVNEQPDNWPPRASSAMLEDANGHVRQVLRQSEQFELGQRDVVGRMPIHVDIPYRTNFTQQYKPDQTQHPQATLVSSGDSGSSRTPPSASSTNQGAFKRRNPDGIDANGSSPTPSPVPPLQYHHQSNLSDSGNSGNRGSAPSNVHSFPQEVNVGQSINRILTPTSQMARRTPVQRPMSAYSDMGPRGRSPGGPMSGSPSWGVRAPSAHSGRSHDSRPISYIDLANISYPQAPPAPISLDNSQLRSVVGSNASLLTMGQTLEMYRQNVKKLNDPETQYAFAIYLIQAAQEGGTGGESTSGNPSPKAGNGRSDSPYIEKVQTSPQELLSEAKHILQKLADRAYPFAQYYLADGYASGLFNKGKEDYGQAFPLFVAASKHGHAESGYRAALCYEFGWGCRKDPAKAVQFYRQSASKNHPGAMTRLGRACLSGDLGLSKYREGLKWLKRATESADVQYNAAPYHLALLYETGYGDDVFQDEVYAAQLFTQAADLGHTEACYRLGDAYEHGKLACPRDPALSVHFYTGAAQRGHPAAMMALCAWYMVGAEPVLEKDENEAYEWARQAAGCGLTKAQYAVGYFTEMGIGTRRDPLEANVWYVKAAEAGDERAKHRIAAIRAAASGGKPMEVAPPRPGTKVKKSHSGNEKTGQNDKDCSVM
ncbi:HCP-like protein [Hyaloscypha variabilis]